MHHNYIDFIRIIIAVLSFIFAIWQYLQKRNIKRLIALEAIELHNNIALALGFNQEASRKILESKTNEANIAIGKTEGVCQAILHESAKLYCNLKNSKIDDIDFMIENNQLNEQYKNIYYSYSDKKRSWLTLKIKRLFSIIL